MSSTMKITLSTCFVVAALSWASCSSSPRYKVDDVVLSDVPVSQKGGMLAAESGMNVASEEKSKAQADVAVDDRDISVTETEYSQAELQGNKVQADLRLADRGKDLNRIGAAKSEFGAVKSGKQTSEAKLSWLRGRRDFHRSLVQVAELHKTSCERSYELEKARLAQATGKRPSEKFSVGTFEQQAAQAQRQYEEARVHAEQQGDRARQLEQHYAQMTMGQPTPL